MAKPVSGSSARRSAQTRAVPPKEEQKSVPKETAGTGYVIGQQLKGPFWIPSDPAHPLAVAGDIYTGAVIASGAECIIPYQPIGVASTVVLGADGRLHLAKEQPVTETEMTQGVDSGLYESFSSDFSSLIQRIDSRLNSERDAMDSLLRRLAAT